MNFLSDNTAGAAPAVMDAVVRANEGREPSYGADELSQRLTRRFADLFETDVVVHPVLTGTAANALSIATMCPPWGAVLCHAGAHIHVDECGAPEFFSGAKLVPVEGPGGKLTPSGLKAAMGHFQSGFVHHVQPRMVSLTQATELGTAYAPDEVAAISAFASRHGMVVHMDGARFANAVAGSGKSPADLTWKSGVDVLSFGATKNGALAAEAVIIFNPAEAGDFEYRRKRSGHLVSKMRFVSAQLDAMLDNGLWLTLASHANAMARRLEAGLKAISGVTIAHPVEANEVFFTLPNHGARERLEKQGARFYVWSSSEDPVPLIRLVCAFSTTDAEVDAFLGAVRRTLGVQPG
jgi:threonine aldolase